MKLNVFIFYLQGLQQENSDQLAGYSGSLCTSEHADAALQDLGSTIMTLSNKRLKNRKWQQEIRQGAATWGELCDIRYVLWRGHAKSAQP